MLLIIKLFTRYSYSMIALATALMMLIWMPFELQYKDQKISTWKLYLFS